MSLLAGVTRNLSQSFKLDVQFEYLCICFNAFDLKEERRTCMHVYDAIYLQNFTLPFPPINHVSTMMFLLFSYICFKNSIQKPTLSIKALNMFHKQGPKRHKPWPIQKVYYSQDSCQKVARQLPEVCQEFARMLPESWQKVA